jgi:uncharacterized protein YciI
MFLLSLTPKALPEQLEPVRAAHHAWAAKGFEDGVLLAGGRLVPPTGGMLFAKNDRAAVEAFVAAEPFMQKGLAEIVVTELHVMTVAPGLEALKSGQED